MACQEAKGGYQRWSTMQKRRMASLANRLSPPPQCLMFIAELLASVTSLISWARASFGRQGSWVHTRGGAVSLRSESGRVPQQCCSAVASLPWTSVSWESAN